MSAWDPRLGDSVAYHWFDRDGGVVVWDGERSPLPAVVAAGTSIVVDAVLRAPPRAGSYSLQWDIVREGVHWVSQIDPTPPQRRTVDVVATHAFTIVEAELPRVLQSSGGRLAEVMIRNDGQVAWPADGSVSLSYHWRGPDGSVVAWEGRRTPVQSRVEPGGMVRLEAAIEGPGRPGRWWLTWDMVDDGVCWFSDRDPSAEPAQVVLVLPRLAVSPVLWSVVVLVLAVRVVRRSSRAATPFWCAIAPIVWFALAVTIKQQWTLTEAGVGLSLAGCCLAAATATLAATLLFALPDRVRPWVCWVAGAMATTVLFADVVHLRFFGDLGSPASLRSAGQIAQIRDSVFSLLRPDDLWFWIDLAGALPIVIVAGRGSVSRGARRRAVAAASGAFVVFACAGLVARDRNLGLNQVFHTTHLARDVGVVNLHALEFARIAYGAIARTELSKGELGRIAGYFAERAPLRAGTGPAFGAALGRNLVMIQVESLQSFVIGLKIDGNEVTPVLNGLAKSALLATDLTDQTEQGRSSDAELATQASLLPPDRGAAAFLYPDNDFTGIAEMLAEHGYTTLSAVPFDGGFWNRRSTHRAFGFRQSLFAGDFGPGRSIGWGLNDRDFLLQALDRLAELHQPWCAYLLTLSLHHPFSGFPEELKVLDVGRWEGTPVGNYLHTMHHFDRALAGFMQMLDRRGLAGKTVVALWGDHDAGFEWRPEIAELVGRPADAAGWYLSQQVPLLISAPGIEPPTGEVNVPAGHVDVAPTLLALLGIDPAPLAMIGRNLLGAPGTGPVIGEYRCWRDDRHLYLRRGPQLEDGQCVALGALQTVPVAECADGFDAARRAVEISTTVLEHDLQQRLRRSPAGSS